MDNPISFPDWLGENQHLLKPPVGNKQMFPTGDDFIVMIVGGPNARTDFHVDPYEEYFYQIKGNMHVKVMTETGPQDVHIEECGEVFAAGSVQHVPPVGRQIGDRALPLILVRIHGDADELHAVAVIGLVRPEAANLMASRHPEVKRHPSAA